MFETEDLIRMYINGTLTPAARTEFEVRRADGRISAEDIDTWALIAGAVKDRAGKHAISLPPLPDFKQVAAQNGLDQQKEKDLMNTTILSYPHAGRQRPNPIAWVSVAMLLTVLAGVMMIYLSQPPSVLPSGATFEQPIATQTPLPADEPQTAYDVISEQPELSIFKTIVDTAPVYQRLLQRDEPIIVIAPDNDSIPLADILTSSPDYASIWLAELVRHAESLTLEIGDWATPYRVIGLENGGAVMVVAGELWPDDRIEHVVEAGESLAHIAMLYGVSIEQIVALNNLPDDGRRIHVGQRLVIQRSQFPIAILPEGMVAMPVPLVHEALSADVRRGQRVAIFTTLPIADIDSEFQQIIEPLDELEGELFTLHILSAEIVHIADDGFLLIAITPEESRVLEWIIDAGATFAVIPIDESGAISAGDGTAYSIMTVTVEAGQLSYVLPGDIVDIHLDYENGESSAIHAVTGSVIGVDLPTRIMDGQPNHPMQHETATRLTVLLTPQERERLLSYFETLTPPATITFRRVGDPFNSRNVFQRGQAGSCAPQPIYDGSSSVWTHPLGESDYRIMREFIEVSNPGIDLGAPYGTPVHAARDGHVIFSGWNSFGYGYMVALSHDHYITVYAHLNEAPPVACGELVEAGQVIGAMGSTGDVNGPRLRFEIRVYSDVISNYVPVNPEDFIRFR